MRLTRTAGLAGLLLAPVLVLPPAGATETETEGFACEGIDESTQRAATTTPNLPYDQLDIARATELLAQRDRAPGQGVKVAVIDSGVVQRDDLMVPLTVGLQQPFGASGELADGHGSNLAGLVAGGEREQGGPTGIAPAAEIVDLRVYDEPNDSGVGSVGADDAIAALQWLAANAQDQGIGVAVLAISLPGSAALEEAVAAVADADVVLVVAAGNRPTEEGQALFDEYGELQPGEDTSGLVFPAAYTDDTFAVTATADGVAVGEGEAADASGSVLLSSDIDAAVPVVGAVTVAVNGATCRIDSVATSWAAGIAGGVVALVRSAYPGDNAAQIQARLKASATGTLGSPTTATGAGVLQPAEAISQELDPDRRGRIDDMPRQEREQPQVTAPAPEVDPVLQTLADARWWGLVAGAGLVVALLARPLLSRRRGH